MPHPKHPHAEPCHGLQSKKDQVSTRDLPEQNRDHLGVESQQGRNDLQIKRA